MKNQSSISILGLLGVAIVVLKLVGVIDWSWWLVLLPFYGGLALALVLLILFYFIKVTYKGKYIEPAPKKGKQISTTT